MAMSYTSLTGSKSTPGSIINWVSYTKLDVFTVVDEAQALIFENLRVREMRTEWTFGMAPGQCEIDLPARFLDPIGRLYDLTNNTWYSHRLETDVLSYRNYDTSLSGSFGTDPFTTTNGSSLVNVNLAANDINQGSAITISGTTAVGGLTLNGTFPVVALADANNFTIDVDDAATSSATGGGSIGVYAADNLIAASPTQWSIWDEQVKFDCAFDTQTTLKQLYYRKPQLLSTVYPTNFLTDRYPNIMRVGCLAAAAQYMKDDNEFQKQTQMLATLVGSAASSNDMIYRGADLDTITPGRGGYD